MIQCTRRESDVLVLLAHGLSSKAMALRLGLSAHTVRDHVCSLMRRHGLSNRVELAIRARERLWQIGDDPQPYRLTKVPATAWKDSEWVLLG